MNLVLIDPFSGTSSLRLPQELEPGLDPHSVEGEIGGDLFYNGSIPPSPPTTCYSPLSSLASESASRAAAAASSPVGTGLVESGLESLTKSKNETTTLGTSSTFSPYTTALSLTIAIGMYTYIHPYTLDSCFWMSHILQFLVVFIASLN